MRRNLNTGFLLGLALGLSIGSSSLMYWNKLHMGEILDDMQKTADEAKHQDTFFNLAFIQMVENGETERLIRAYCTLLHTRLRYVNPESIEDTELRIRVIENINKAELVVARLESEGKCRTNR